MGKTDKPFVVYRRRTGSFTILPRGPKGWAQFAAWIALLAALIAGFAWMIDDPAHEGQFAEAVALFVLGLVLWLMGGLWWIFARAEIVDTVALMRDRQRAKAKARRER